MALPGLRSRLISLLSLWAVLMGVLAAVTVARLQGMAGTLETVFQDRLMCQAHLRAVDDAFARTTAGAVARWQAGTLDATAAQTRIAEAQAQAAQAWQAYRGTYLIDAEKRLIAQAEPLLAAAMAAADEARRHIAGADRAGLADWARGPMSQRFTALGSAIDPLFALQQTVTGTELQAARANNRRTIAFMLTLMALGCAFGGGSGWWLVKRYTAETRDNARALGRMNAFYTALSRTNHLIVRGGDESTLLNELCRICTETGHTGMTAVFLLEGRQAARFACAGPRSSFFDDQPVRWAIDDPAYGASVTAIALATGEHRVGRMAEAGPEAPAWRQRMKRHGIRAVAAFPIHRAGQVYAALSLYATEADFFDDGLVKLLAEMAADVSFALDNIDREAARARLRQQTQRDLERFQALFQASPVACVITALADARVLEINDAMCDRFGLKRADYIGVTQGQLGRLMIEADAETYRQTLARDGRVRNMEAQLKLPDGSTAVVIVNAEVIDYQGQPSVMAMGLDITDLRAAAAAQQAHAAAEAANRAKTAFLSQMSHELRTPLNAMLGFTQLMQRDARSRLLPQDIEQLEHIRRAGWHLMSLLNDVMDVSRIESGQFEVRLSAVPLAALVDEVLRLNEPAAAAAGVSLQIEAAVSGIGVLADPVRLRQVFINLLSNAIKYNRPGGRVEVCVQPAGGQVLIEVADTGLGMTEEQLRHLYEPFNRLGRERGGIEGTGLGLALTRQLVGLMGGELAFESRSGIGTRARVTLPAASLADAAPAAGAAGPDEGAAADEPQGTVLYIEDNEINVMLIEDMLSRWAGVRFVHAPDGASGVACAARMQPELVLMDMQLPDMGGVEILRRLRADEATAQLRVIALSADDAPADVREALAHGAVDYWTKPIELQRFLQGVSLNLAAAAAAASAALHPGAPLPDR
jgi:PAS domain S-box-containing protein